MTTSPPAPGTKLHLRVTPGARRNALVRTTGDQFRISVTAAPEKGKANAAVLKLLARSLGVPKSRLRIVRGDTGRDKTVEILD